MRSYKRFADSKDVQGKIDCSFRRRSIPFMVAFCFFDSAIEMLDYGLTLNQNVFELCLVQLVNF